MTDTASDLAVPTLPSVEMHLHRPNEPVEATVVKNEVCTASRKASGWVRHIEFDVSRTDIAGRFRAGQSFGVVPPGTTDKGVPHKVRLYSISSPTRGEDGAGRTLATTVKRTIDEHWDDHSLFTGVASNYLCDREPGDTVMVAGPNGKRFLLPEDPSKHRFLFFATGTGIAPFRGMLGDLYGSGAASVAGSPPDATLVMGVPYATDLIYHNDLLELAGSPAPFSYLTAVSRETQPDVDRRLYVQDRLETNRDELTALLEDERTLVYICGIAGMELGIFQQLAACLPGSKLDAYLEVDPELAGVPPAEWTRKLIPRKLKPTKRVFLEVY
ncbi:MAG: hypothetical protein AAF108_00260 [Planctomycetota bacterium]